MEETYGAKGREGAGGAVDPHETERRIKVRKSAEVDG